ncbi:dynamin family protein [Fusobacterium pseudoperiodonticum]|uniref:dynamin family protein n=1 Tax=Fusobacterium pseudoperiodonticum TaxID=2663009 RepID=UPI0028D82E53|nr:dynamin family protein [Fusobacterium pseudoperiodonticum]
MKDLRDYSIYYYSEDHPLKEEKKEFKKLYLNLLNHCGCLYLNKNIVRYKLNIFKEKLNFDDEIEELNSDDKILKRLFKKVLKQYFKLARLKFYTYRYIFFFDCLVLFGEGNKRNTQIFMEELKKIIVPLYHYEIDEVFKNLYSEKFNLDRKFFISEEMLNKFNTIKRFSESKETNIVFTATMSTGKSTLINAIIGKELAPSMSIACTGNVANFKSSPIKVNFINYFDKDGLKLFLDSTEIKKLIGKSNYCHINTYFNSEITKKKVNIIDTPGVNYSEDKSHRDITKIELKNKEIDILVYVTSILTWGTNDEYEHLKFIKENVKYKKMIVVINKVDEIKIEDSTVDENISNAKKYLLKLDLKNLTICPLSAYVGSLLKREILKENLSKREERFVSLYLNQFANEKEFELSKFYKIDLENKEEGKLMKAYINTGLPIFEKILYNFI